MFERVCVLILTFSLFLVGFAAPAAAQCTAPEVSCSGQCVDMSRDDDNCGACGVVCKRAEVCEAGKCVLACPAVQLACGNVCATPASDPDHCGGCNQRCADDEYCSLGSCQKFNVCAAPLKMCSGQCRDTQVDRRNCGACGKTCLRDEVCDGGRCVAACVEIKKADQIDPKDIQTGTVPVTAPKKKKPRLRKR
jgi:hypothetical protein